MSWDIIHFSDHISGWTTFAFNQQIPIFQKQGMVKIMGEHWKFATLRRRHLPDALGTVKTMERDVRGTVIGGKQPKGPGLTADQIAQ